MPVRRRRTPATRTPQQQRSRATVEAILEASARILEEGGPKALTTARIAQVAGVGVGSLYEYFPDKESVITALCERRAGRVREAVDAALDRLADVELAAAIAAYIDGLYELHLARLGLERELLRLLPQQLGAEAIAAHDRYVEGRTAAWLATRRDELRIADVEAATFVLIRAGRAVIVHGIAEGLDPERLARTRAQLKDMVLRTLLP